MNYVPGLEGVIAGETAISHVEGEVGRLSYRGYPIEELVMQDYLAVVYLVLFGEIPSSEEHSELEQYIKAHQHLNESELQFINALPTHLHPMAALQAVIPLLTLSEDLFGDYSLDTAKGLQVLAKLPEVIAAIRLRMTGGEVILPEKAAPYLDRYLALMNDDMPCERAAEVFKVVQILQLDHSFNAGTFAGRVIASTLADVPAVLAGAAGALSGVLHGGADQAALEEAFRVGSPQAAAAHVEEVLSNKGRIMGMGHREYRTVDPRSLILKPLAEELCLGTSHENTFNTLLAIEQAFNQRMQERGKSVWANLEFYKGVVYQALGIETSYFTATFALSRSVGWLAHFLESRPNNKIIRPAAAYIGASVESRS